MIGTIRSKLGDHKRIQSNIGDVSAVLFACATDENFPSYWLTKFSFFSCVYDNASKHCKHKHKNEDNIKITINNTYK